MPGKNSVSAVTADTMLPAGEIEEDSDQKFEIYGDVLIEKTVKSNGKIGRIYLPMDWVGKKVKIIKLG